MKRTAFTLIELMIVVAIIGILAAIAIPKFSILLDKSKEGYTKGELATVRTAVNLYYSDNEGVYPTDDLSSLLINSKYLSTIPIVKLPFTPHSNSGTIALGAAITDTGGWAYDNVRADTTWGHIAVNCTHANSAGDIWSSF